MQDRSFNSEGSHRNSLGTSNQRWLEGYIDTIYSSNIHNAKFINKTTAPTVASTTNNTQVATTAFINNATYEMREQLSLLKAQIKQVELGDKTILKPYITFSGSYPITISCSKTWNGKLEYSLDNGSTWQEFTGAQITSTNNTILMRGIGNTVITGNNYNRFAIDSVYHSSSQPVYCTGNIENLLDYQTVQQGKHPTMDSYCFYQLFYYDNCLRQVPLLPALTLAPHCYESIFSQCYHLTKIPDLPALTLADYCYQSMFAGCHDLTTMPTIYAETMAYKSCYCMFQTCTNLTNTTTLTAQNLAEYCYSYMFSNCTALTTAPKLTATNLKPYCYYNMFYYCTSLTTMPELPATELQPYCYAYMFQYCSNLNNTTPLIATTAQEGCYSGMFDNCTSLTTMPTIKLTTMAYYCCGNMFSFCTSLINLPTFDANTTLANYCYSYMFAYCTSITQRIDLRNKTLAEGCYSSMFDSCSAVSSIHLPSSVKGNAYLTNFPAYNSTIPVYYDL